MKELARLAAAAGLGLALAAAPARAQPIEMIITDELATTHWSTKIIDQYAEDIAKRTGGRITPKVFHAGTLYKDQDAVAALGSGTVHMVRPAVVRLETIAPQTGVVSLPFSLTDEIMLREGAPKAVGDFLSQYVEPRGIKVLGLMRTADLMFIFKDKVIGKVADLRGQKVRVTGGRVVQGLLRAYDANPVSMAASEMTPALVQGAIDGIFTSPGGWEIVGVNAAKKASYVPGLNLLTYAVLFDKKWLEGLAPDLRKIVEDTTAELVQANWSKAIAADKETLDRLLAAGGELHEVKGEALAEFRTRAEKVSADFVKQQPQAWEALQKALAPYKTTR